MASEASSRHLLCTGGAGFVGSNFVRYWRQHYPQDHITVIDYLGFGGRKENLPDDVEFIYGNICDIQYINNVDTVIHFAGFRAFPTIVNFAAETHVDRSIAGASPFIQSNIVGTYCMLEYARKHNCRFHHVSTDEVYGSLGKNDPPFTERSCYNPRSPYAASKAASDHLVRAYYHTYGLPITITSCCNNYGRYQNTEKMIPLMITNALQGKTLPVYGDGLNVRQWLHVTDHCHAIEVVLKKDTIGETYNVGGGTELTNLELVHHLCDLLPYPRDKIQFVTDRPGHDFRYAINDTKLRGLGYAPRVAFGEGLMDTIDWYRENEAWWR